MAPSPPRFCMFFYAVLLLLLLTKSAQSANILCLLGTPSIGHHVWNKSLLVALFDRGHNLTVLTADETTSATPPARMHFIHMSGVYDAIYENRLTSPKKSSIAAYLSRSVYGRIAARYTEASQVDGWLVESDGARRMLDEYPGDFRFDIVLHDSYQAQALLGFVDYFGRPPLVALSPAGEFDAARIVGGVSYPSYVAHPEGPYASGVMTIIERTRNLSYFLFDWFYRTYVYMVNENRKARKLFGTRSMRMLESIEESADLVLLNVDFALDSARLLPPNVIPVGGLQVQRNDVLDSKLQQQLDDCTEGAIYIYLASNPFAAVDVKVPRHVVVRIFKELRHLCFVWSTDEQHTDRLPSNVLASDWMPQNAILAHPNVKLIISHGGRFSVQEAAWHAVPHLVLAQSHQLSEPARTAIAAGAAARFDTFEVYRTVQIINQIRKILSNSSRYSLNAQQLSQRFRSTPLQPPLDRAVRWIEATLRNGDSAHLRPHSLHLNFLQIHVVDIWLSVSVVVLGFLAIFITHCCCRKGVKRSQVAETRNTAVDRIKKD